MLYAQSHVMGGEARGLGSTFGQGTLKLVQRRFGNDEGPNVCYSHFPSRYLKYTPLQSFSSISDHIGQSLLTPDTSSDLRVDPCLGFVPTFIGLDGPFG